MPQILVQATKLMCAWLRRQEWYVPPWQCVWGQEMWMHTYLMTPQSQSLAGVCGITRDDMGWAPFQTNVPIRNPSNAVFSPAHPDGLTRHKHGKSQSRVHASTVLHLVLFLETWPLYRGTPVDWWCPHRAWHRTSYSWSTSFCSNRSGPLICIQYSSHPQWSHHKYRPHSPN